MLWKEKLKRWESGTQQSYPCTLNKRFFYETSRCCLDEEYIEVFVPSDILESMNHDPSFFSEHFGKEKHVVVIPNLSNTSILIIPVPRKRKKYTTMKDFIDNASCKQQREFWKTAAENIRYYSKNWNKLYVSTHGLGAPYFHLRLDKKPKYYVSDLKDT